MENPVYQGHMPFSLIFLMPIAPLLLPFPLLQWVPLPPPLLLLVVPLLLDKALLMRVELESNEGMRAIP